MQYCKSERFLKTLYFVFALTAACFALIIATDSSAKWDLVRDEMVSAGVLDSNADNMQSIIQAPKTDSWIIRAHDDRIGVFKATGELDYIVDVHIFSLPPSDQELLKNGIWVSDEKELAALMEDYTG